MTDRRTRLSRIAADMRKFGVVRTAGRDSVAFGRVRVAGKGTPLFAFVDQFAAGDSIQFLAKDFGLTIAEVTNGIRFTLRYPRCERPSFWKGLPDHMPPKETMNV